MLSLLLAAILAQTPAPPSPIGPSEPPPAISVTLDAPTEVRVGRIGVYRAIPAGTITTGAVDWDFGDGVQANGAEATHIYEKPGIYLVRATFSPTGAAATVVSEADVTAFRQSVLLFSASEEEVLAPLRTDAQKNGNALSAVAVTARSSFLAQEALVGKLREEAGALEKSDTVVFALPPDSVLNALASFGRTAAGALEGKTLVLFGERSSVPPRLTQIVSERLRPDALLFTQSGSLPFIVRAEDPATLPADLAQNGWTVERTEAGVARTSWYAPLANIVDRMLRRGVPSQTILLLLMVPAIIAIITFFRQVVGLNTMGVYVPLTLSLSFIVLGTPFAVTATVLVFGAGLLIRQAMRRARLMYVPRVGLNLSFLALVLLFALLFLSRLTTYDLSIVTVFPLLIMVAVTERVYNIIAERKMKAAFFILLETTVVAFVATVVTNEWQTFRGVLFAYPELVLAFIGLQWIIGKYTGLRATEVLRFRDLLNEVEYAEEE